jgi:glyoxylase-like metal-dependent hydrolase (beta-lactamase superfamily II)
MAVKVSVQFLDTGCCLASEALMLRGGRWKTVEVHSLVALVRHPDRGWLLWDTGYAPRMLDETRGWPNFLYRLMTPLRLRPEGAIATQLPALSVPLDEVRTVVLSHLHADHMCGLRDLPAARFVLRSEAWEAVRGLRGLSGLRKAFIPGLMPDDFEARADLLGPFDGPELPPFGSTHDLLGDGSLRLVDLPGHARGHLGMLAETERGPLFLVGDAAWMRRAVRELRPPHPAANFMMEDLAAARDTLAKLHVFQKEHPETVIVPTHCPEAYGELVEGAR